MAESAFTRFWNSLKPPPSRYDFVPAELVAQRRRQRRLVLITVSALVLLTAGVGFYKYRANIPQRAEQEFQDGMKAMRPGKYKDAIDHLTRSLALSPGRANAFLERGNAHRFLGEPDQALADFQTAAGLDSTLVAAHNGVAMIYLERHDSRHALEEFNKSIAVQPTIEAYFQRGQILEAQGDHQKAVEDYNQAIALDRDEPFMYRARATARESLGDQKGAQADRISARQLERP